MRLYTYLPKENTADTEGLLSTALTPDGWKKYQGRTGKTTKEEVLAALDKFNPDLVRSRTLSALSEPVPDTAHQAFRDFAKAKHLYSFDTKDLIRAAILERIHGINVDRRGTHRVSRPSGKKIDWSKKEPRKFLFSAVPHYLVQLKDGRVPPELVRDEEKTASARVDIPKLYDEVRMAYKAGFTAKVASVLLKAAAVAAPTHAVAAGDTLSAIARRNGTTVQELARINAIKDPSRLRVGQRLRLPAARQPVRAVRAGRPQTGQVARANVRPAFPGKNNNPVNMRYYGVGWNGERPAGLSKGDFTRFDTPQNGARAGIRNLMTLGKRHGFTLNGVMPKFSPSSENDTGRHIKTISAISNIPPDKVLDPKNTGQMVDLLRGVIRAESGKKTLDWFQPIELTNAVLHARQP